MLHSTRNHSILAAAIAGILATADAGAQSASQLPEVVVTARQRAENIEEVPATVQAFTEAEIKSAGIERPQDFIALTPGVSQVQTAEAGDMQVVIRGINTGRDAETNFALVVDGVLQTNPNALNQELTNVTQIEVLKGPQGALYGRNAVAGAIIMTTRKPGDEAEFEIIAGYGSDNSYKGSLYAAGPLGGSASGSLSAYTRSTDGQWDNEFLGCDNCVDYFEETGAIGRLVFDAGDSGEIDFKAKVSSIESGAINFNASLALAEAAAFLGVPVFQEDANAHPFHYINNVRPVNEQDNLNLSLKGDWDVGVRHPDRDRRLQRPGQFLPDGRHQRRVLSVQPHRFLPDDQRRARAGYAAAAAVLLRHPERRIRIEFPAALQPDDLRRLPVPGAQPGRHEL